MLQTDATAVVAWTHVRKVFPDGFEALRDVSLTVARGELLAILGTSGSGEGTCWVAGARAGGGAWSSTSMARAGVATQAASANVMAWRRLIP